MEQLTEILRAATEAIDPLYFSVPVDGSAPVYRERAYCYELYHQMRVRWPEKSEYYLNGELDKIAHPKLAKLELEGCKPDFIVHKPGQMDSNLTLMEVKTEKAQVRGITKDLGTLSEFVHRAGYRRAIYLLFGGNLDAAVKRVMAEGNATHIAPIELWIHTCPLAPAEFVGQIGCARVAS